MWAWIAVILPEHLAALGALRSLEELETVGHLAGRTRLMSHLNRCLPPSRL